MKTAKTSLVCEYGFAPKCITETEGFIAAGGIVDTTCSSTPPDFYPTLDGTDGKGLFSIYNQRTDDLVSVKLGALINNCVSLFSTGSNHLKSIVCNNDKNLYFLDVLPSGIILDHKIKCSVSLNNAELSPDRKTLICSGDSKGIYVFHDDFKTNHPEDYQIETDASAGFSTTFHPSGVMFATAFQSGKILLYDTRYLKNPLKSLKSTRCEQQNGSFRAAKFIPGPEDFLAFSEHLGRVHIVDTRNFDNHQVVLFPTNYGMPDVTPVFPGTDNELGLPLNDKVYDYEPVIQKFDEIKKNFRTSISQPLMSLERRRLSANINTDTHEVSLGPHGTLVFTTDNRRTSHDNLSPTRRNSSTSNNYRLWVEHLNQSPRGSLSSGDIRHGGSDESLHNVNSTPSISDRTSDAYEFSNVDISGLCWSGYDGGSLIIGTDKGITRWKIDSWARRCFSSCAYL